MALIDDLKANRMDARKKKDAAKTSILTTLLGELETDAKAKGTEITDDVIIAKCKKFIKNNEEAAEHANNEKFSALCAENYILTTYIPRQMDRAQLKSLIAGSGAENIGQYMKFLNSIYKGKFDGKEASAVAKEHFQ